MPHETVSNVTGGAPAARHEQGNSRPIRNRHQHAHQSADQGKDDQDRQCNIQKPPWFLL